MPKYGAIGATFILARVVQACSLIAIIGLTANFIAEIVASDATPPGVFIGTITVTCIATIYCLISSILFVDDILPFLACSIMDLLVLIAVIVVAVVIGKPLSYLECNDIGNLTDDDTSAYTFATHLANYLGNLQGVVDYKSFVGTSESVCLEAKSIWGLSIAMCIMFFITTICGLVLWRQKAAMAAPSEEKGGE